MDNALKFTSSGGKVDIKLADRSGKLEISVSDTGKGIPEDAFHKIFEKFSQVPGTKGGTGLGLTIANYIVQMHGGQITVASKVNKGTAFSFWIPKK